ncbi:hypothetical protein BX591_10789 [Paraburkholderia bryophila]|uniref:Uncharacterized protein n=1 Tax=Paraburkholderia bryophila TaxID=420952 RepID=A0A329CH80_9BURK|nr:hypothetical protein BX591_10789 [Paraburkholderia bryophila]
MAFCGHWPQGEAGPHCPHDFRRPPLAADASKNGLQTEQLLNYSGDCARVVETFRYEVQLARQWSKKSQSYRQYRNVVPVHSG